MQKQRGFSLVELMLALALGSMIACGLFQLMASMLRLHQQQVSLSLLQNRMRFLSYFLLKKIRMAGDCSCLLTPPTREVSVISGFDADDAKEKLGLHINSGTQLLQLRECVRWHQHMRYLPIQFFIAQQEGKNILFYQIAHYRREALASNVDQLQLTFGISGHPLRAVTDWSRIQLVHLNMVISDHDMRQFFLVSAVKRKMSYAQS